MSGDILDVSARRREKCYWYLVGRNRKQRELKSLASDHSASQQTSQNNDGELSPEPVFSLVPTLYSGLAGLSPPLQHALCQAAMPQPYCDEALFLACASAAAQPPSP